jgi:hypothetical protein
MEVSGWTMDLYNVAAFVRATVNTRAAGRQCYD